MEREVGGGIGMGNTCKPMDVSFQCKTKSTTKKKKKKAKIWKRMVTKKRKRMVTNLLKLKIKIHVLPKHFCPSFKCKRQLTKSNLVIGKLKFPGFNSWVFFFLR